MNIIRNTAIWILSLAAVFILYSSMASADDRFTKLEAAWNAKDSLAVQENFSRANSDAAMAAFSSARLGAEAEQGERLVIKELVRLKSSPYGIYGTNALLDGKPVTWIFVECDKSTEFCGFMQRKGQKVPGIWKAAGVDAASTALALGAGFAEGNPLGLIGATVIKGAIMANVRNVPFEQCVSDSAASDLVWTGAGVANLLTMMGAPMGVGLIGLVGYAAINYDAAVETAVFDCAEYQFAAK